VESGDIAFQREILLWMMSNGAFTALAGWLWMPPWLWSWAAVLVANRAAVSSASGRIMIKLLCG
jgi:hypothetical protein